MEQSRFNKGLELLSHIDGDAGHNVIESLQDICPDLAQYTIEYPFGDIYARPGLDLKSREIATVAALTAMGNCTPQLKVHKDKRPNNVQNDELSTSQRSAKFRVKHIDDRSDAGVGQ